MTSTPLSLYIHFPWCIKKCPYCDFNSHQLKNDLAESDYIQALIRDFENDLEFYSIQRPLVSIFMGGGTPSLFSGSAMKTLLRHITSRVECLDDIEITMETNPGAVEHDQFELYLEAGINRLSFGAQSFDNDHLKQLGRIHNSSSIHTSIGMAKQAGFSNFNIDLMYGLPNQNVAEALQDCQEAIDHSPAHLSLYQLTIEPNTLFHKYPPILPDQDTAVQIQEALVSLTARHEYERYEVSAYAKTKRQSQHNINYWQFGDYLGIGAGAHSKISNEYAITRSWKQKHPDIYLDSVFDETNYANRTSISRSDVLFEFLMNALRLTNGFRLSTATKRTGLKKEEIIDALQPAFGKGWMESKEDRIKCSPAGYLFLDEILVELLPQ